MVPSTTARTEAARAARACAGRWLGVVACGGAGRRMGADKALIEVDGEPLAARAVRLLAEWADEVVLASGPGAGSSAARFAGWGLREVPDAVSPQSPHGQGLPPHGQGLLDLHVAASSHAQRSINGQHSAGRARAGPLAAIVAALEFAGQEGFDGVLLAPCDLPCLATEVYGPLLEALGQPGPDGTPVLAAHWRGGARDEPLVAALAASCGPALRAAFDAAVRRPTDAYGRVNTLALEVPAAWRDFFVNVNSPEDLAALACAATDAATDGATDGATPLVPALPALAKEAG